MDTLKPNGWSSGKRNIDVGNPTTKSARRVYITGHNSSLSYFQAKLEPEINSPCLNDAETFYHLLVDCPSLRSIQTDIFQDLIPIPDMSRSIRKLITFIENPTVHNLLKPSTNYAIKEVTRIDHSYTDSSHSSLQPSLPTRHRLLYSMGIWGS